MKRKIEKLENQIKNLEIRTELAFAKRNKEVREGSEWIMFNEIGKDLLKATESKKIELQALQISDPECSAMVNK